MTLDGRNQDTDCTCDAINTESYILCHPSTPSFPSTYIYTKPIHPVCSFLPGRMLCSAVRRLYISLVHILPFGCSSCLFLMCLYSDEKERHKRKGERRRGCLLGDTCATHRALRAPRNIFPCAIREKNHQGHARKRQSSRLYRSDDYRPSAQPTLSK